MLGCGLPDQRYFRTRAAAQDYIAEAVDMAEQLGPLHHQLRPQLVAELLTQLPRLEAAAVPLIRVVDFYYEAHPNGEQAPQLGDFLDAFLAARRRVCSEHTLANYASSLRHVRAEFSTARLTELRQTDIEEWVDDLDLAPRTVANILNTLTTVLNDACRKGLLPRNPAEHMPRPAGSPQAPGILVPAQAAALLAAAETLRPAFAPALVIALFAGLRRSELCALRARHLILEENLIEVTAAIAKTRRRRLVDIQPNLALGWLIFPPGMTW